MAKVTGPLFSIEARGAIAKAMVHFPWKGINVVRGWVTPANPMSAPQGNARLILGSLGRATSVVAVTSPYYEDLRSLATGSDTWVSAFVKWARQYLIADTTAFNSLSTTFEAHTGNAAFDTLGADLGLPTLEIAYADATAVVSPGFLAYLLAATAISIKGLNPTLFNRAPYTTALASWTSTQTDLLETDLAAV